MIMMMRRRMRITMMMMMMLMIIMMIMVMFIIFVLFRFVIGNRTLGTLIYSSKDDTQNCKIYLLVNAGNKLQ